MGFVDIRTKCSPFTSMIKKNKMVMKSPHGIYASELMDPFHFQHTLTFYLKLPLGHIFRSTLH